MKAPITLACNFGTWILFLWCHHNIVVYGEEYTYYTNVHLSRVNTPTGEHTPTGECPLCLGNDPWPMEPDSF
jgi:hypothetical protein